MSDTPLPVPMPAAVPMPAYRLDAQAGVWHSLDLSDPLQAELYARAMLDPGAQLEARLGLELEVTHVVIVPASKTLDTGEVVTWPRTVLIAPTGQMHVYGSHGVYQSLLVLATVYGLPPWRPPVRVRVLSRRTQSGHWYYLSPVVGAPAQGGSTSNGH